MNGGPNLDLPGPGRVRHKKKPEKPFTETPRGPCKQEGRAKKKPGGKL